MSIKEILETYRTIAVVGLSSHTWRPSFSVSRYMQSAGYRIIPVNPSETEVLGERAYPALDDIPEAFEIVDIFRRSEYVPDIVEAAIRRNARGFSWGGAKLAGSAFRQPRAESCAQRYFCWCPVMIWSSRARWISA